MKKSELSRIAAELGRKGGSVQSPKQRKAAKVNLALHRKYSACPHKAYKNHAHRFGPAGVCYGCKITRKAASL
jgi:hypothetical protein